MHVAALRQEKNGIESLKAHCVDRIEILQTSLNRAELNVTVLQSQWATNRQDLDALGEQLIPTQELAHTVAARLLEMEKREEGIWSILKELREDVFELKRADGSKMDDERAGA